MDKFSRGRFGPPVKVHHHHHQWTQPIEKKRKEREKRKRDASTGRGRGEEEDRPGILSYSEASRCAVCARRKKHEATTYSHGVQVSFVSAALRCRCIHTTRHPPPRGCLHLFRSLVSPCVDARVRHVGGVGIWKGRKGHSFSFSLSLSFFLSSFFFLLDEEGKVVVVVGKFGNLYLDEREVKDFSKFVNCVLIGLLNRNLLVVCSLIFLVSLSLEYLFKVSFCLFSL